MEGHIIPKAKEEWNASTKLLRGFFVAISSSPKIGHRACHSFIILITPGYTPAQESRRWSCTFAARPTFSLYSSQARCNLIKEEAAFLDNAHLDVQTDDEHEGDETSDDERFGQSDYPLELQWRSKQDAACGSSSEGAAVTATTPESTDDDAFKVADAVYFHKPANLGGAAGMAALQQRWFEGSVKDIIIEESGFSPLQDRGNQR